MSFAPPHPWLPPASPDLARLAFEAADAAGLTELKAWPVLRNGGLELPGLPPFLCWRSGPHLLLLQARELGALVPGAKAPGLPLDWLEGIDPSDIARPLARHPDFSEGLEVQVIQILAPGCARVRGTAAPPPGLLDAVLRELSGLPAWDFA